MGYNISYIWTAVDKFTPALKNIGNQVKETQEKIRGFKKTFEETGRAFKDVGGILTKYVTLPLTAAGVAAMYEANRFQNMGYSLQYIAGSADKAKTMLNGMIQLSEKTPFSVEELEKSAGVLTAYGMAAKNIQPTLSRLGDIASGSGADLAMLADAYGRILQRGYMTSGEASMLNMQHIPFIKALAKYMELPQVAAMEMANQGIVSAAMFEDVMKEMTATGGRYYGAMANKMNILGTASGKLKQSGELLADTFGQETLKAIPVISTIQRITQAVYGLSARLEGVGSKHPQLMRLVIWGALFAAALGTVLIGIGALIIGLSKVMIGWMVLKTLFMSSLPLISAIGTTILSLIVILTALGNTLRLIWKYKDALKSVFTISGIKDLIQYVTGTQQPYYGRETARQGVAAHSGPGVAIQTGPLGQSGFTGRLDITLPRGVTGKMSSQTYGNPDFDTGLNMAGAGAY